MDDRVFVLGLDWFYREAMKPNEKCELRGCAARLAARLAVTPADVPIEGYYGEDPELTAYFRTLRALQEVPDERRGELVGLPDYERLLAVNSSVLFGRPVPNGKLFPRGRDPLALALMESRPPWNAAELIARAALHAIETDDVSLVGIAARTRDAVALAAVRESVVLYAEVMPTAFPSTPDYQWRVSDAVTEAASRFIAVFRSLFPSTEPDALPAPDRAHAEQYWSASNRNDVVGRCVWIGRTDVPPIRMYHWAIRRDGEALTLDDFWANEVWTTSRYKATRAFGPLTPERG